jgi:hypothetical protein
MRRRTTLKTDGEIARHEVTSDGDRPSYDTSVPPLWEIACKLSAQIPEEELAKVPTDASLNLHHYLYSAPRIEE